MSITVWWRRQRDFIDFCLASLLRRKVKNLSLLAVYALIIFGFTSVLFFAEALKQEAVFILQDAPEIVVQRMQTGRYMPIPRQYGEAIAEIRGVRAVTPRYWGYYFHPAAKANYTVMADPQGTLAQGQARMGVTAALVWSAVPGGSIVFKGHDGEIATLTVAELLPATTELLSADLIVVHPADFAAIFGLEAHLATDLSVAVRNPKEVQKVAEKIVQLLPDARPVLREEMIRTYGALFDWRSGYMLVMLGGALLAFFIFALDKATGLSAEERAEIAILKAVGWDTADVLTLKFHEGLIVSLSAFLLGVVGAYLHVFFADGLLFAQALKGWSVIYPQWQPAPAVDFYQLAAVLGLTVFPYAVITMVPAWRAATIDPDTVMRQV